MGDLEKKIRDGVLGDIKPEEEARDHLAGNYDERDDANWHSGSRELDEGGGVHSEVDGVRNYHGTGGATGGDLGNRPE